MLSKVLAFGFLAGAAAECANSCSGHGHCSNYAAQFSVAPMAEIQVPANSAITAAADSMDAKGWDTRIPQKDSCTCFTRTGMSGSQVYAFTGYDCSFHTCPHAISFNGPALSSTAEGDTLGNVFHTQHLECSNQGSCNRKTGSCECYKGYTGEACQRTVCPNNCNGAGTCLSLERILYDQTQNTDYYGMYINALAYSAWDKDQMQGCVCDEGRRGADCSMVDCPSGPDTMKGAGAERGRECSGRGKCNWAEGVCNCFTGYLGASCETQYNGGI